MIPFEKVKKEISRHVHPNDQFYLRELLLISEGLLPLIVEKRLYHKVQEM